MRTTGRMLAATAIMGGSLLLAAPASAQTATPVCPYPFDCPTTPPATTPPSTTPPATTPPATTPPATTPPATPPTTTPPTPIGGGGGGPVGEPPATTPPTTPPAPGGGGGGGSTPDDDDSPVVQGSSGGAAGLPFTGGEVTLIALTGLAALGGGAVLVAAGRKRTQA